MVVTKLLVPARKMQSGTASVAQLFGLRVIRTSILWLYRDNGKENGGNYYIVYWGYMGIYRGSLGLYLGCSLQDLAQPIPGMCRDLTRTFHRNKKDALEVLCGLLNLEPSSWTGRRACISPL